jgi:AcrR family transcriptional regulator
MATKEAILEAAVGVFLAQGFAAASMDQIRQAAGVSNGSLYHHFPTKAALADALYAHTLRGFHAQMFAAVGPRTSAQNGVKGLIRVYVQWVLANPGPARLLHDLRAGGALTAGGEWAGANAEGFGRLAQWIAAQVEAGHMRDLPFGVWMALVFAPVMALTRQWVTDPAPGVPAKVRAALEHAAWMAVAP